MHIRLATRSDAPAISRLVSSLAAQYITVDFSAEGAQNLLRSMESSAIERYLAAGYRYHIAEEAGEIVGVVGTRDNTHLYHLFVAASHHRHGIATALWHVARAACIAAGNTGAFTVNSSRFALPLYTKLGFVVVGPEGGHGGVFATPMRLTEHALRCAGEDTHEGSAHREPHGNSTAESNTLPL